VVVKRLDECLFVGFEGGDESCVVGLDGGVGLRLEGGELGLEVGDVEVGGVEFGFEDLQLENEGFELLESLVFLV
jgi:hypothetical protein